MTAPTCREGEDLVLRISRIAFAGNRHRDNSYMRQAWSTRTVGERESHGVLRILRTTSLARAVQLADATAGGGRPGGGCRWLLRMDGLQPLWSPRALVLVVLSIRIRGLVCDACSVY